MSIQVSMVQNVLYFQMALVLFLLQPYFISIKMWIIKKYNFIIQATVLKHIIIGLYVMVGIMLVDSTYKWNKSDSLVLMYQNEKNFYLCVFSLFLAVVLNKLCKILENTFRVELLNKQTVKQNGNSREFVSSVIEGHKSEKEKLENEVKRLESEVKRLENSNIKEDMKVLDVIKKNNKLTNLDIKKKNFTFLENEKIK